MTFADWIRCPPVMLQHRRLTSNIAFATLFVPLLYPQHCAVRAGTMLSSLVFLTKYNIYLRNNCCESMMC